MAQIIVDGGSFSLSSEWKCAYHPHGGGNYYIASGPTTASRNVSFTYTLPMGAIIKSAKIRSTWGSPNTGFAVKTINGVTPNASNNYMVDVDVATGTHTLTVVFKFRANGKVYNDTSKHSGTTAVSDVDLVIDYTVPMSGWTLNKERVEAGQSIAVTVKPAMEGCTHRITWTFGKETDVQSMATGVNSKTLTIPMEWCKQIPNATSGSATVMMETIMNGSVLGRETKGFTVVVPENVVPKAGEMVITGNNMTWGMYLQNRSTATITASGYEGAQGSTIAGVRIEGGGYAANKETLTTGTFASIGKITFTLRVTDSRGRTATKTDQIMVTAYSTPSIIQSMETRADDNGNQNGAGTWIRCEVLYTWSAVGSNEVSVRIEYKRSSASAWVTAFDGNMESGSDKTIGEGHIELSSAWDVRYTVYDTLGNAVLVRKIPTGYVYMLWDPKQNALGFGCYPGGEKRIQVADDWKLILGQTDVVTALARRDRAANLLDNSDFRRPVNQRGQSSYSGNQYTIDRWRTYSSSAQIIVGSGFVTIESSALMQYLDADPAKVYTAAVRRADGGVVVASGTFADGFGGATLGIRCSIANDKCRFLMEAVLGRVVWAALYEGAYTADALPAYVPKGFAAELLECQRYYYKVPGYATVSYPGYCSSATNVRMTIQCPVPMRITPSISAAAVSNMEIYAAGNARPAGAVAVSRQDGNAVTLDVTSSGLTERAPCTVRFNTNVALIADL